MPLSRAAGPDYTGIVTAQAASTRTEIVINGMTCQGCVRGATRALQAVAGVSSVVVELDPGRATVRWQPTATADTAALVNAVTAAGFEASLPAAAATAPGTAGAPTARSPWSPFAGWRFNAVLGGTVTLILMAGEWIFGLGMVRWFHWLAFALTLPVQVFCGARFYRGAFNQLRVGQTNMDTLVSLGSTTAFAYSVWGLFTGSAMHLYFMEAAGILTFISIGHWLEALVSARAAGALRQLMDLAPPKARWLSAAGVEIEVPVANLVGGDRVALSPGDRIPTDGLVREGTSDVDEAMLTGESWPVTKRPGAPLYAGTVNQSGRLIMEVTAMGDDTALAHIIAVVQRAQNSRASIQRLGDQVSSVFVPIVVLVALATGLAWSLGYEATRHVAQSLMPWLWTVALPATPLAAGIIHAAGVLIVACPCAMGLATPVAIMAGANVAARRGILIRDAEALEKTGRLNTVVFDKTGTLTEGRLEVAASTEFPPATQPTPALSAAVAALAASSRHPVSLAAAAWAARPAPNATTPAAALAVEDWREVRGAGVEAVWQGQPLRLGSQAWLRENQVDLTPGARFTAEWSAQAATVLGLACGPHLVGLLAVRDNLKANAATVVRDLQAQGKRVVLITGDQPATATAVARLAGIEPGQVFADVRPERKASLIEQMQREGQRVAFVGDGINDAPALEQADLGIAVSRASDVAREAADLILLRSDIDAIPEALGLAQATLRTIRQNLFWAFFYNAAAIPLAALGFLSPMLCALAMGCSDLVVIGNALRLRRYGR